MAKLIRKGASKSEIREIMGKGVKKKRNMKVMQLAGALKSKIDPVDYQRRLRDEWQ
jgi:hypothetical protein